MSRNPSEPSTRLGAVMVTFDRPVEAQQTLDGLARQVLAPEVVIVVDNGAVPAEFASPTFTVDHVVTGANLGPAGALDLGISRILDHHPSIAWVVLVDDDDPPPDDRILSELVAAAEQMTAGGEALGGIGMVGATLDQRRGRLLRPSDELLDGMIPVSYLGGGQLPVYSCAALRTSGARPDPQLFFGFDDLDLGLRLTEAGHPLFAHGPLLRQQRATHGRLGLPATVRSAEPGPAWRRYYSTRNLVHLLRARRHWLGALAVSARAILRAGELGLRQRSTAEVALAVRAIAHGWLGRLGRTVEPERKPSAR